MKRTLEIDGQRLELKGDAVSRVIRQLISRSARPHSAKASYVEILHYLASTDQLTACERTLLSLWTTRDS